MPCPRSSGATARPCSTPSANWRWRPAISRPPSVTSIQSPPLSAIPQAKAEAHFNAYRAALEQRDWASALRELIEAVKLDGRRFAPFPVGKYHPLRILGAGGFGVAFLCKHKYMDAQVVVKALMLEDLGRDADKVFAEAQVLQAA